MLVLAGGLSTEREVSLRSGHRVVGVLRRLGVDATLADVDAGLLPRLEATPPSVVFLALHGSAGEDGALPAILEAWGVRFVGSSPDACRLAFDKASSSAVLARAGISTPEHLVLPRSVFGDLGAARLLDRIADIFGLPVVVKPVRGGSALGMSVVRDRAELTPAVVAAFAYGPEAMVERFVAGREIAVSVVDRGGGPEALPPVEIVPPDGVFDYAARYSAGATRYFTPARLEPDEWERAADVAVRSHRALGLGDVSRVDAIVDANGVHVLEVNVAPGLTETSMFPMAVEAAGLDLGELLRDLLNGALARPRPGAVGHPGPDRSPLAGG